MGAPAKQGIPIIGFSYVWSGGRGREEGGRGMEEEGRESDGKEMWVIGEPDHRQGMGEI